MNRKKKFKLNTISSIVYQLVSIVAGFVLPRFFLVYYGSDVNGLISSITQFLAIISLCECGVGAVVQAALYKPIAENDESEISRIYVSAKKFFNRIVMILLIYIAGLVIAFPFITDGKFDFVYTTGLIIAMSINLLSQYYFGIVNKLILNAAQLVYVQMTLGIITIVLNVVISVALMYCGFSVQIVKFASSLIFLIQPVCYTVYVRKTFKIDKKIHYSGEPIKQKWNGFAQHVATVVLENTDVLVLTVCSTLSNVSIYSVYHLVTNGLKLAFVSSTTGFKSLLGDMYAKGETKLLDSTFGKFEWLTHMGSVYVFTVASILIVPFVEVYTKNVHDADYLRPLFGQLMCLAMFIYVIRQPYNYMIASAGKFKETQTSAFIETLINLVISFAFVYKWGLIGVAVGTAAAMTYRTIYFVYYMRNDVLHREVGSFWKLVVFDVIIAILIKMASGQFVMTSATALGWTILAAKVSFVGLIILVIMNLLFYRKEMLSVIRR